MARTLGARWRRALWGVVALLAVVAVSAGSAVALQAYRERTAPERVVLEYFAALARGDAAAALAYGDLPDVDAGLLTDEVLAAQLAIARPTGVTVEVSVEPAAHATAHVQYDLAFVDGAQRVDDTIELARSGRTWRLRTAAVPVVLRIINGVNRASVAGAAVPEGPHLAFPGALPVTFDTANLSLDDKSRVVRFAQEDDVQEVVELSEAGQAAVDAALDDAVEACLAGTADPAVLCPLPPDPRAVPGTLRGTPDEPASQTGLIRPRDDDGLILIDASLTIDGEYQRLDFNNQRTTESAADLTVSLLAQCFATSPDLISWRLS